MGGRSRRFANLIVGIRGRSQRASRRGRSSLTGQWVASSLLTVMSTLQLPIIDVDERRGLTRDTQVQHDGLHIAKPQRSAPHNPLPSVHNSTHHRLLRYPPLPNLTTIGSQIRSDRSRTQPIRRLPIRLPGNVPFFRIIRIRPILEACGVM